MRDKLEEVRDWAKSKIASGQEPPWAWFQYMKLIETSDAILSGMDCVITKDHSQQSELHQGMHLRLVDSTDQQGNAQHRPAGLPVLLPM